ncbi:RadC family protein [Paramaledivibacter caminithermalis]|jgi:DNA repair protein RadC|uniref:DNA replication and repair protein RadC n=1 Tax=Paramaledivibacter caminithermalis (strain DSM 15212 / CIP 107654 / DViRD3) TaxID=1121301 RepID=A0A1M6MF55_PARC5|nr:DNA repair protein RadC [Paramaledivibacter caminithermalis]SHJ82091.1 DNA replication and repair protein RadC [Paramaledivibacter caminithermalis DSM 15212]
MDNFNLTIKRMPESERPREKLIRYGADTLSNSELLAILIRTGTKEHSALELANILLSHEDNGIRFLANSTIEELSKIKGIGKTKACQIIAAVELGNRLSRSLLEVKKRIKTPRDVTDMFINDMRFLEKEYFKVIFLNTKNEIITYETISIGSLNASIVHPREVFNRAIKKSSASIILLHNHPSGNPEPSKEDINITKRLIKAGEIVGIEVLDHIIIGDGNYFSLKENSLI